MPEESEAVAAGDLADSDVVPLPETACWEALAAAPLGRLAVCAGGEVDVFPVNFVVTEETVCFRTAPGSKLAALVAHPAVAFEVDGFDEDAAWSVVVKGTAHEVASRDELERLELLALDPWIPTLKYRWVRISPSQVSGLVFRRGPEPPRD